MYSVSSNVKNAIMSHCPYKISFRVNNVEVITSDDVVSGSVTVDRYAYTGESIEYGTAIAAELKFQLRNADGKWDDYVFTGKELEARVIYTYTGTSTYTINLGRFTILDKPRKGKIIEIAALDRMCKFDKPVDKTQFALPLMVKDVISKCCTLCGVTAINLTLGKHVNRSYYITALPEEKITYRQLIAYCAQMGGMIAFINQNGYLDFNWWETSTSQTFTAANRYESWFDEESVSISGVKFDQPTSNFNEYTEYVSGSKSYCMDLTGNPLIINNPQTVIDAIANDTTYRKNVNVPCELETQSCPWIFPMNAINNGGKLSYVSHVTHRIGGRSKIKCIAESSVRKNQDLGSQYTKLSSGIIQQVQKVISAIPDQVDLAAREMNEMIGGAVGLKKSVVNDQTYFHDADTLADSTVIFTMNSGGFAWAEGWNDGSPTWHSGMTADGNIITRWLTAHRITADMIEAGSITADKISTQYTDSVRTAYQSYVDGQLTDYMTKTEITTAINQAGDSITLEAIKRSSQEFGDSNNMLLNTATLNEKWLNASAVTTRKVPDTGPAHYLISDSATSRTYAFGSLSQPKAVLEPDNWYTFSFQMEPDTSITESNGTIEVRFIGNCKVTNVTAVSNKTANPVTFTTSSSTIVLTMPRPTNETIYTVTFQCTTTTSSTYSSVSGYATGNNSGVGTRISRFKLEKGKVRSDYSMNAGEFSESMAQFVLRPDLIQTMVTSGNFGTVLSQSSNDVKIAWNNISNYISIENAGLSIYDSTKTDNSRIFRLNKNGMMLWKGGVKVGQIGTNIIKGDETKRGLDFDLDSTGAYMCWAASYLSTDESYFIKMLYANTSFSNYIATHMYISAPTHFTKRVAFENYTYGKNGSSYYCGRDIPTTLYLPTSPPAGCSTYTCQILSGLVVETSASTSFENIDN